ncbi:hypothetical protein A3860_08405 [Niastella vici]|uniref:Outer membrane protein beta-barrel domain-containing protein n=1 Tax=Niastella vici TaxID=1703345 RepID=A0A1V9FH07_9BACT|nr:outer membrane beta-barrel protein [Niastella vici]OQP57643.1 hypothetical protein A3860_08405 [Niastella vici]
MNFEVVTASRFVQKISEAPATMIVITAQPIHGCEASLDVQPSGAFSAFLNFTYQKGKQNNGSKKTEIPNFAAIKGNLGLTFHVPNLLSFNLISNWMGPRSVSTTNPVGKVKGYFITNLVINTNKLFDNRVAASLNIRNLFNHTYWDPGIRSADGNLYSTVLEQPGINGVFKVAISLN